MGHRIEPSVSIPTKLQTDSTGYTLESVIHIGRYSLLWLLWNPGIFQIDHFLWAYKKEGCLFCMFIKMGLLSVKGKVLALWNF